MVFRAHCVRTIGRGLRYPGGKQRTRSTQGDVCPAEARRKNNPPTGIAPTYEVRERQTACYAYGPHMDLQLVWTGKAGHTSFEVDGVSLRSHAV